MVSFPGEPAPLTETIKPLAFKNSCSTFTSAPVLPTDRSLVKGAEGGTRAAHWLGLLTVTETLALSFSLRLSLVLEEILAVFVNSGGGVLSPLIRRGGVGLKAGGDFVARF